MMKNKIKKIAISLIFSFSTVCIISPAYADHRDFDRGRERSSRRDGVNINDTRINRTDKIITEGKSDWAKVAIGFGALGLIWALIKGPNFKNNNDTNKQILKILEKQQQQIESLQSQILNQTDQNKQNYKTEKENYKEDEEKKDYRAGKEPEKEKGWDILKERLKKGEDEKYESMRNKKNNLKNKKNMKAVNDGEEDENGSEEKIEALKNKLKKLENNENEEDEEENSSKIRRVDF